MRKAAGVRDRAMGRAAESRGAPPPPQDPSPLRGTLGSSLRSPAEGEGHEGFPPPPDMESVRSLGQREGASVSGVLVALTAVSFSSALNRSSQATADF